MIRTKGEKIVFIRAQESHQFIEAFFLDLSAITDYSRSAFVGFLPCQDSLDT